MFCLGVHFTPLMVTYSVPDSGPVGTSVFAGLSSFVFPEPPAGALNIKNSTPSRQTATREHTTIKICL